MHPLHLHRLLVNKVALAVIMTLMIVLYCQLAIAADIAAFGDSITQGVGSTTGGYPPKLAGSLNLNSETTHVVDNHGSAGEPTAWGNGRIHSVLESKSYQYILILEGTNDIFFGLSLESTQYYLEAMINKAKNLYGVSPLIANLTPDTRQTAPANQKNIETNYNPLIAEIASSLDVPLVDLHSVVVRDWEALSDDQLHPNDAGYQLVADTWFRSLMPIIQEDERNEEEEDEEEEDEGENGNDNDDDGGSGCFIGTFFE